MKDKIIKSYEIAVEQYAEIGVDVEDALKKLENTAISLHCWQADDVGGFEHEGAELGGGGIQVTGNYPGKARNLDEMRADLKKVYNLIPGLHRLNLHAIYGDFGGTYVDRDAIGIEQFKSWVDWAKSMNIGLDFNGSFFSHPKSDAGYTLASKDKGIRDFWIEHAKRCREISAFMGKSLNNRCVHNIWIPDGEKDITVDRMKHRNILREALDEVLTESYPASHMRDALESKLFGIGSESFVVGSHEFYLGYAVANNMMLCIDIGHFHPTESCADKVSAVFQFVDELLLHVTRGVRWDSDHIVILNDSIRELMQEIVWADKLDKVCVGLDFFDASVNRLGAYVLGTRAAQKALLLAFLDPVSTLREYEDKGQFFQRLALLEEAKSKPFGAVYDYYCLKNDVPVGEHYIAEIEKYEKDVLSNRS